MNRLLVFLGLRHAARPEGHVYLHEHARTQPMWPEGGYDQ